MFLRAVYGIVGARSIDLAVGVLVYPVAFGNVVEIKDTSPVIP